MVEEISHSNKLRFSFIQGKVPLHTYGFLPNSDSIETLPITEDGVTQHEIELPDKPEITIDADTDGFEEKEFQDDGNVPAESFFIKIKQVNSVIYYYHDYP